MDVTRINAFDDARVSVDYLDITSLKEGMRYTKIAYVQNVSTGLQKNNGGFVSFYLKDCNGYRITARLFNVEDFMLSGIKASAFIHLPVKVSFVPQVFRGTLSLVIDSKLGIEKHTGDFDYTRFVGKIEVPAEMIVNIARLYIPGWELPREWEVSSIDSICNGKAGGFTALVYSSMFTVSANATAIGGNKSVIMHVFFNAMDLYYQFLERRNKSGIVAELIDDYVLSRVKFIVSEESEEYFPTYDAVRALCGFSKPLSLDGHLIKSAVDLALFTLNANDVLTIMPTGSKTSIGGVDLLKY